MLFIAAVLWYFVYMKHPRRPRSIWTHQWLLKRPELGAYDTLLSELREEDKSSFLNFLRVSPELFDQLVDKVTPLVKKADTPFRKAVSPGMRLAVTLRYLATGT